MGWLRDDPVAFASWELARRVYGLSGADHLEEESREYWSGLEHLGYFDWRWLNKPDESPSPTDLAMAVYKARSGRE